MPATPEERTARATAEQAREANWHGQSFLRDLFMGRFRLDLLHPFPTTRSDRPAFLRFRDALVRFLREEVDPVAIDHEGEYPARVIRGLAELGAFGMTIDREYGGLGLSHIEYVEVMKLLGSHCANVTALLSAHQAIGVPRPLALFGTEEQRRRYLPRCARGAISAFALTEPDVGSDPARLTSIARPTADGRHYELSGEKLWCTNGTLAELIVVMARNPDTDRINAFVVETDWAGVHVEHRCRFMGLRALANGHLRFDRVLIPASNRIGEEGDGLRIALATLNTGRLSLPAATTGAVELMVEVMRKWANARVQWGAAIGKHEAVAHMIADTTAKAFAMESIAELLGHLADREDYDIRLEAAAAKEWNTVRAWEAIDDTLQVRGGRGYETERSLANRGEVPIGVERAMRDARIDLIFEGSSEIMHLFMAREAVDRHLQIAGSLVDPDAGALHKLAALPRIAAFYAWWYPTRWIPRGAAFRFRELGRLAGHVRFVERRCRRLARAVFHGMVVHRGALEHKQAFLFRLVDIAMELFAMTATVARVYRWWVCGSAHAEPAAEVADVFCRTARRKVDRLFHALWHNDDARRYALAREVLDGRHTWLEAGTIGLGVDADQLAPTPVAELLRARGELPPTEEPTEAEPAPVEPVPARPTG